MVGICVAAFSSVWADPMFSESERTAIVTFWNEPGRYTVTAPADVIKKGVWQPRLTVEGSRWLQRYQRSLSQANEKERREWEAWVKVRTARDEALAKAGCDLANNVVRGGVSFEQPAPTVGEPVLMPAGLVAAAGNAPPIVAAAAPLRAIVAFDDSSYEYTDHVPIRHSFVYYRFSEGTVGYGPRLSAMPESELDALFGEAGMTASEAKVAKAVSKLEGGFETINTYDTGYISVGFIQFTTGEAGRGSLIGVMRWLYDRHPVEYGRFFRRYGIEVTADRMLVVVDPSTGVELTGADAVLKAIQDKRLIAVFQRAGRLCREFRIAQIAVAKSHYWAGDLEFTVTVTGVPVTARVGDIIRSEAGLATLYDRRVNRGNISPFTETVQELVDRRKLTSIEQIAEYEREIVAKMRYRVDFLNDASLSQPE